MIDHVLGRPSPRFRKIQVLAVVTFWSLYLLKYVMLSSFRNLANSNRGPRHGPSTIQKISQRISNLLTPWQIIVITLLYLYTARNIGRLIGLECPEPLANLYTRSYFRATWVTTALDAGFWSAMRIRRKWLRDLASVVFTIYYLVAAEQADEKVRKVRGALTVEHLRVSWNKSTTPYIKFLNNLLRPRFMRYPPRQIRIARPANSDYTDPIGAWLYFDGPLSELKNHDKVVIDIPGGGFIAMNPRHNDDKLIAWAGKTGYPVLSLDYKKAPEYPYPYALNECFDAYRSVVNTRGLCFGLAGNRPVKVILTGDSAGGNLVTSLTLLTIQARQDGADLPLPDGIILIYPGLDMNIGNWMSDEQMALIKDRKSLGANREIIRRKSMQYTLTAGTPHRSEEEDMATPPPCIVTIDPAANKHDSTLPSPQFSHVVPPLPSPGIYRPPISTSRPRKATLSHHPSPMNTRLAMSSLIAYFNDRILSPEMMRAMMILYIGPHNRPDFSTDYLLSPNLAPDSLLVDFPKTYIMTGERDPLVDDTVIFAGRLRRARAMKHAEEVARGEGIEKEWDDDEIVEVSLIPGISHGFLQFTGCFPEGWKYIHRIGKWINQIFEDPNSNNNVASRNEEKTAMRARAESSGDEDALEMAMTRGNRSASNCDRKQSDSILRGKTSDETNHGFKRRGKRVGHRRGSICERRKSMVSLASEEDLLGRRMLGLAGPLTRVGRHDI
ncbi:hypothetical protein Golomagni_03802 [Golovinomyces magnicellulatus]|nr:hypothetical protein Golomagni_03802 [Golovinomyces magnicellulatus]